jgi:hypothetical protein
MCQVLPLSTHRNTHTVMSVLMLEYRLAQMLVKGTGGADPYRLGQAAHPTAESIRLLGDQREIDCCPTPQHGQLGTHAGARSIPYAVLYTTFATVALQLQMLTTLPVGALRHAVLCCGAQAVGELLCLINHRGDKACGSPPCHNAAMT